ncbi:MAG: hypothetical protein ABEJ08_02685 [Halobacteriaceae archaeon]
MTEAETTELVHALVESGFDAVEQDGYRVRRRGDVIDVFEKIAGEWTRVETYDAGELPAATAD